MGAELRKVAKAIGDPPRGKPTPDNDDLVQISLVHLYLERRPRGSRPTFETRLRPDQQIVGFENYWTVDRQSRETIDHHANIWVATRL